MQASVAAVVAAVVVVVVVAVAIALVLVLSWRWRWRGRLCRGRSSQFLSPLLRRSRFLEQSPQQLRAGGHAARPLGTYGHP